MSTILQQIKKLEAEADIVANLQNKAKSDGGRLTLFGQDLLYTLHKHGFAPTEIAKILDVTPSAVTQQVSKIKAS